MVEGALFVLLLIVLWKIVPTGRRHDPERPGWSNYAVYEQYNRNRQRRG